MSYITFCCFLLLVHCQFIACITPSKGCNKPFEVQDDVHQDVFYETVIDMALGPVEREFIVQFPPG